MKQQRPPLKKWQIVAGGIVAVVVAIIVIVGAIAEKDAPTSPAAANTTAATTEAPATQAPEEPEPTSTESEADTILTAENNKDLAAVIAAVEDYDLFKEFAANHEGRTIEFDGTIAAMANHGDYKTRYDILVLAGNNIVSGVTGPNFQFRDVDVVSGLNLTGLNIPDTLGVGQKLHIAAQVADYDENADLFLLDPVSVEVR